MRAPMADPDAERLAWVRALLAWVTGGPVDVCIVDAVPPYFDVRSCTLHTVHAQTSKGPAGYCVTLTRVVLRRDWPWLAWTALHEAGHVALAHLGPVDGGASRPAGPADAAVWAATVRALEAQADAFAWDWLRLLLLTDDAFYRACVAWWNAHGAECALELGR
jgi:hypothetical protein